MSRSFVSWPFHKLQLDKEVGSEVLVNLAYRKKKIVYPAYLIISRNDFLTPSTSSMIQEAISSSSKKLG